MQPQRLELDTTQMCAVHSIPDDVPAGAMKLDGPDSAIGGGQCYTAWNCWSESDALAEGLWGSVRRITEGNICYVSGHFWDAASPQARRVIQDSAYSSRADRTHNAVVVVCRPAAFAFEL